uniref:Tic20 family protein Ycf60 n=1 Tax=Compsopogon caeruleus TaxID=31354 RepID=A0A1Z1XBC5_9RHOD|nr:hypothetical protein [Compsopogon caeruleus]ARX96164.1 hypothetical protein [Compsopogon caeruleus]
MMIHIKQKNHVNYFYLNQQKLQIYFLTFIATLFIIALIIKIYSRFFPSSLSINRKKTDSVITTIRFISILPYFLPFLEGVENFGLKVLSDYPFHFLKFYKKTIAPFVVFYVENRSVNLITFLTLYFLIVNSKSPLAVSQFLRFNTLQALLIFLLTTLIGSMFRSLPMEFRVSLYGLIICNSFLWLITGIILYAITKCFEGKYSRIPVISEAVKIQIESKGL